MEDKSEWPTEVRLQQLRAEGQVPRSHAASVLLIAAAFCVGMWLSLDSFRDLWSVYQGVVMTAGERGAQPVDTEALSPVGWSLIQIGLALPIGAAVLVVLLGLFQSKFLVRLSLLRLDIQRLLVGPLTSGGLGRGLRAFLITLVTLAVVLVSSVVLMPVVSAFLGVDPESFQRVPELFLRVLAFACGVVGVAAAVVLIVVSQLEFRHRNRMSSKEVREEAAD